MTTTPTNHRAFFRPSHTGASAAQQARDLLERMGIKDAQSFRIGRLMELANLIADLERCRTLVREAFSQPDPGGLMEAELNQRFDQWWYHEGSGMPPLPEEDQEAHVHRVSQIAWRNGAYVVRQGRSTAEPVPTPCGEEA